MQPLKLLVAVFVSSVLLGGVAYAAPWYTFQKSILPSDATENLGTTSSPWDEGHFNEICLTADCRTSWPGGSSGTFLSTSSPWSGSGVAYRISDAAVSSVATSSLTATSPLSLSQPISVLGSASSALTLSTTGDWTGTLDGFEGSSFTQTSRQLTVAGTANQITSSAGAQTLAADRTWTLSLPSLVVFPNAFTASYGTTTYASSTAISAPTVCVGSDCRTSWPTGSGSGLATTSPVASSNLLYYSSAGAGSATGVATTTLTGTGVVTISNSPVLIGASGAVASITGGANGQILGWSGGVPAWVATTTAGTGLTYNGSAFTVNTSQNISTLSNLTSNGFVKTSGGTGALSVDTNTYLTAAVTAIGPAGQTADGPTVTQATSSDTNIGLTITGSGDTLTYTSNWIGTLANARLTNSTISGVALGANLAAHTNDATLLGSSYNGSAAVSDWGIDLANPNTWTGLQQFSRASTSMLSSYGPSYFGGTATSSFSTAGVLTLVSPLAVGSGGTGLSSVTANAIIYGNAGGTAYLATATSSLNLGVAGGGTGLTTCADNRVITGTVAAAFTCEANLTFTGSALTVTGTSVVTTSETVPIVYGGSAAGSTLTIRSTSGAGIGADAVIFGVGNNGAVERMRMNLAGLGMGTTTPQWPLQIASSSEPQLVLTDSALNTTDHWTFRNSGANLYLDTAVASTFATTSLAKLTILSTGRVGIGSSTPFASLGIGGAAGVWPFSIGSSTNPAIFAINDFGAVIVKATQPATSTAMTLDWAATGQQVEYRIGAAATTISLINATTSTYWGTTKRVWVCNPGSTAGAITWQGVEWIGTTPTQTTTADQCDIYSFNITRATSSTAFKVAGQAGTGFR